MGNVMSNIKQGEVSTHHKAFDRDAMYREMYRNKISPDIIADELGVTEDKVMNWLDGKEVPSKKEQNIIRDMVGM